MSAANMPAERQAQTGQTLAVAAVVLAAGKSNRMGGPKPLLPWGRSTMIVLGDQLQLESGIVCRLVEGWARSECPVPIPVFKGGRGHPLLLDRRMWPELLAMDLDRSIRDLVHRHWDELCEVVVESSSVLVDLDTAAEYRQALRQ